MYGDLHALGAADQDHVIAGPGADHHAAFGRSLRQRGLEILGLIKRAPFMDVADDVIHLVLDQTAEIGAVAVDAERVRQRDPGLAAALVGRARGLEEGLLALVLVEEIALEEQVFGLASDIFGHILGAQIGRDAQIGVHRPFAIRRDKDHRARGRQVGLGHRVVREIGPFERERFGVEPPQRIVAHPPDKGGAQAKIAQARQRVGDRPARRLGPVAHRGIERLGPVAFDQLHDALGDAHVIEERLLGLAQDIDDGIADADDLVAHAVFSG